MNVVWLPLAVSDLEAQIDYIADHNLTAALQQAERVEQQVDLLPDHPEMGRVGRVPETRELVISGTSFIVVYRVRPQAQRIEILRLLHGAQEGPKR